MNCVNCERVVALCIAEPHHSAHPFRPRARRPDCRRGRRVPVAGRIHAPPLVAAGMPRARTTPVRTGVAHTSMRLCAWV